MIIWTPNIVQHNIRETVKYPTRPSRQNTERSAIIMMRNKLKLSPQSNIYLPQQQLSNFLIYISIDMYVTLHYKYRRSKHQQYIVKHKFNIFSNILIYECGERVLYGRFFNTILKHTSIKLPCAPLQIIILTRQAYDTHLTIVEQAYVWLRSTLPIKQVGYAKHQQYLPNIYIDRLLMCWVTDRVWLLIEQES